MLGTPARWIAPDSPDAPLIWGRSHGVVFGVPSDGGMPGPRGLIRVGVWNAATGEPELVNFVAIEPVIVGDAPRRQRMGYSELEPSELDPSQRGKRLSVQGDVSGELNTDESGVETLSVRIEIEPFTANGARVYVVARMRSDRPDEVAFDVHAHDDSAPIDELTLTATMGNYERLRLLWLNDRVIDSRALYAGYDDIHFVEKEPYPLADMLTLDNGDAFVMCSSDEPDPTAVDVGHRWWQYKSKRLTQYWRVPKDHVGDDLRVRVNGRRCYWAGELEIPGGVSFENFETRQRYAPGQRFIFGLTEREPWELVPEVAAFAPR